MPKLQMFAFIENNDENVHSRSKTNKTLFVSDIDVYFFSLKIKVKHIKARTPKLPRKLRLDEKGSCCFQVLSENANLKFKRHL